MSGKSWRSVQILIIAPSLGFMVKTSGLIRVVQAAVGEPACRLPPYVSDQSGWERAEEVTRGAPSVGKCLSPRTKSLPSLSYRG